MNDKTRILRAAERLSNGTIELLGAANELSQLDDEALSGRVQEIRKSVVKLDKISFVLREHITRDE